MKIKKIVIDKIEKIYSTCIGYNNEELTFIGSSEGPFQSRAFNKGNMSELWSNIGGTMNVIQIPLLKNKYLATRKFLPVFAASECELNLVTCDKEKWNVNVIMKFPYLHRFDLFIKNGEVYLIGATLCESKDFQKDWSKPGSVFVGKIDINDLTKPIDLKEIYKGITKNHGMWHSENFVFGDTYLIGGSEGAFAFVIPENPMVDEWKIKKLLETEVSDMATVDIDGDGQLELATIEGFHGNDCNIYKFIDGKYKKINTFNMEFGHVIWGGEVAGENMFLLGARRGDMNFYAIRNQNGKFVYEIIDKNVGPSQISVKTVDNITYILSANRQINELAIYNITK